MLHRSSKPASAWPSLRVWRGACFFALLTLTSGACSRHGGSAGPPYCHTSADCPPSTQCNGVLNGSLVCVTAICNLASNCCGFRMDEGCDAHVTASDASCVDYLKASRASGTCLDEPSDTSTGLCKNTGSCDTLHGQGLPTTCCTSGYTCQASMCAACAPMGAACDRQVAGACCVGMRCDSASHTCGPLEPQGGACSLDADCAPNLYCGESMTCGAYAQAGAHCDLVAKCDPSLACMNGVCATPMGTGGSGSGSSGSGGGCDPATCNGSQTSCDGDFCFTCYYACSGASCQSHCSE